MYMNFIAGSVAALSIERINEYMPCVFPDVPWSGLMEEKGSSMFCSEILIPKSMLSMADFGTTGLVSEKLAMDPINPSIRKNPTVKAIKEPTKVPKTILKKFFMVDDFNYDVPKLGDLFVLSIIFEKIYLFGLIFEASI